MLDKAKQRYEELMLELATRRNNEHIGSGLGGNPAQYLTMLSLTPNFSANKSEELFSVHDNSIEINVEKIQFVSRKEIRYALDKALTSDIINKYAAPELISFFESFNEPMPSDAERLATSDKQRLLIKGSKLAIRMKELSESELKESGEIPSVSQLSTEFQQVYNDLKSLDNWIILIAVRRFVGIETMVKYNLDEIFFDMFNKINSAAGEP